MILALFLVQGGLLRSLGEVFLLSRPLLRVCGYPCFTFLSMKIAFLPIISGHLFATTRLGLTAYGEVVQSDEKSLLVTLLFTYTDLPSGDPMGVFSWRLG